MRKFFAIIVCKFIKFIGGLIGKGSSLPGKYALKICPDILSRIKYPDTIIAVTGSNGKTSTTEMIAHTLTRHGKTVAYNSEGSNQIEGVTTMVLDNCTLSGKINKDVLLIESDERYAKYTFKWITPTYYIITNLFRDQLTRNGHPLWVYDEIKRGIPENTTLVLNADDPLVSSFSKGRKNVLWFGIDKTELSSENFSGAYNDGNYCPLCFGKLSYDYYHFSHIGKYQCQNCGYKKHNTEYTVTDINLDEGKIVINNTNTVKLAFKSIYNIYNILAAFTACSLVGVNQNEIANDLSDYILKNGRYIEFTLGMHKGVFLVSKHENSISYDMSFRYIAQTKEECSVIIIVDAVSRKYFTSDTSWLWDIDFDLLGSENIKNIYLCGKYCYDLDYRISFTDIDKNKIRLFEDVNLACQEIKDNNKEKLFAVTCFSDKGKFISNVKINNANSVA